MKTSENEASIEELDIWVPHELMPKSLFARICIYETLQRPKEIERFLARATTNDEE